MKKKLLRSDVFKRVLSMAIVLVMLLGMVPVGHVHAAESGTTVYLVPNANWQVDNARFAVYYWNGSANGWVDAVDNGDGYYEAVIPAGYTSIIFCRMNPSATENSWDNKWNQTGDLTVPTDGTNCYTVAEGTWDAGGGTWSTYTPDSVVYLKPNSNWLIDGARFAVYYWDDAGSYWTDMSDADGDGYYEATIPAGYSKIIFCRMNPSATANDWTNKWNQTSDLTIPTDGTNCYTVADGTWDSGGGEWSVYPPEEEGGETEETAKSYYLYGWLNGADVAANNLAFVDGKLSVTLTAADNYVFVKDSAGANYMTDGWLGFDATSAVLSTSYTSGDKLYVPAGAYEFTLVENGDGTVTLSYAGVGSGSEETPSATYIIAGTAALCGTAWDVANTANTMALNADGLYEKTYADVPAGAYEFKVTDGSWDNCWGDNGNNYAFTLTETSNVTILFNADTKAITVNTVAAGAEIPEGYTTVTIHFYKTEGWGSSVNAYVWTASGALTGYEEYNAWPGKAISANASHAGWYDLIVATGEPTAFNFIFNDGGNQAADLYTGEITGNTELWVVGNTVSTTAPGEWTGDYDYTANIHFQKPESWGETVNLYTWNGVDNGTWPGSTVEADEINAGWYNYSVTLEEDTGFSFIFNDGSNQTGDLSTGTLNVTTDIWVVDGAVRYTAPAGWVDPARTVHVPGTFPGPSWDAASNQMTYDAELGLYVYTFEDVPAANYEFKIAINGSWSENYGAGGVKDGSNIAVTVPGTMDVTVYYNDNTHNAVTNVTYKFVDAIVSGTGIEETKLTDAGLTGIYSGTVSMAAGTYDDVVITCDGVEYVFTEIVVEEDKDVTFYIDPVTGIFYCNASNTPIDTASVYFNSQDETYKAPYGAVAQNEEVTFSIATGTDVTSAVLVIKGVASVPMEKAEDGLWTAATSIANIGEYDYYFALSNGSNVAIYGDDDGYYGEGKVSDLTNVIPYDLVVYEEGYETPDWMKNAVIYQIFPDRFFDGDESNNQAQTWARGEVDYEYITDWYALPENPEQEAMLDEDTYLSSGAYLGDGEWSNEIYGGDLEGIIQRIDYLKALGVNVIYLNPVFWSISNHRYDAVDYTEIDPILGTLGDFEELVAVAEANDMHIILDGVFNHVSDDSVYFDRYYKFLGTSEKIGAYPYWAYVYDYMSENGADQETAETAAKTYFSENYGITDWSYTEWFKVYNAPMTGAVDNIGLRAGKAVYSYDGWWGYDSMPIIYSTNGSEYQTGNWAETIIDGEDSVNAYWISKGMDGWRLDVANEVSDETWQNFRDSVKALDSDAVIIGEIWDDATKYLMGDMYDSVMNYQFRNAVTSYAMGTSAEDTTKAMEKIRERYPEEAFYAMMNLVGSHDTTRILSYLDGIGDDRNQKDFDSAFPTYEGTSQLAKDRQYLVSFLQFTYAGAPTIYYGDEIGMVGSDDPDDRRAFEWGQGNQELVEWYATLAAIREAYPALRTGSVEPVNLDNSNLLAFVRADDANSLIVIANNSQSAQTVTLEGTYVDLVTGETFDGTVPALNGVILVAEDEVKTVSVNYADLAPAYDPAYIVAERCAHTYDAGVVTAPTCTEDGYTTYTCTKADCGYSYTAAGEEALGHSYETVVTAPTCTEDGYTTYTCTVCGDTYTADETAAIGHSYEAVVTDPTCTEQGYTTYTCTVCGDSYVSDYVDATGHDFDRHGICTVCGEKDDDNCHGGHHGGHHGHHGHWDDHRDDRPGKGCGPRKEEAHCVLD